MIQIPDSLQALYTARVEQSSSGDYTITIPETEIEHGAIEPGGVYRVALLSRQTNMASDAGSTEDSSRDGNRNGTPPVSAGDTIRLSITEEGDRGDGIGYIDGYVVFVAGASPGDSVVASIDRAEPTYAIADLLKTT